MIAVFFCDTYGLIVCQADWIMRSGMAIYQNYKKFFHELSTNRIIFHESLENQLGLGHTVGLQEVRGERL